MLSTASEEFREFDVLLHLSNLEWYQLSKGGIVLVGFLGFIEPLAVLHAIVAFLFDIETDPVQSFWVVIPGEAKVKVFIAFKALSEVSITNYIVFP